MKKKTINVNELQAQISQVLKETQQGNVYQVMRYSEPIAVVMSYDRFLHMQGDCKQCVEDLRKIAKKVE